MPHSTAVETEVIKNVMLKENTMMNSAQHVLPHAPFRAATAMRKGRQLGLALVLGVVSTGALAVEDGHVAYNSHCAECHRPDLTGALGPALTGKAFMEKWGQKVGDLKAYIHSSMPLNAPDSLTAEQYTAIIDYILAKNGLQDGEK
jgi:mono/diheme cytochrome c family protein